MDDISIENILNSIFNLYFFIYRTNGVLGAPIDPNVCQPPSLLGKVYKICFSLQSKRINTGLPPKSPFGGPIDPNWSGFIVWQYYFTKELMGI